MKAHVLPPQILSEDLSQCMQTPIRKQTLLGFKSAPFSLRGNVSNYHVDYYIESILSLCSCLYILYYLSPIACLYYIVEKSLGVG